MKVAFVSPYFYPDMAGGMEWYSLHITQELVKQGVDVGVFTQKTSKKQKYFEIANAVKINRFDSLGFSHRLNIWFNFHKKLKEFNPDIITSLDYSRSYSWSALRFGLKNNIPTFIMVTDIISKKKPRSFFKQILLEIFDKFFAKIIFQNASKLLLRTKWTSKWIIEQGISKQKIAITPSGLTKEELSAGKAIDFEKKFGISKNIILFLGTIRKQKGAMLLLEAFEEVKKEVKEAKLVFVGPSKVKHEKKSFVPELIAMVKKNNIKNVYFLGPLFGQDKINALAACDVMAMPSSFENFGQTYSQAMAQSKPVIGTTGGGIPEIIHHNKNGFLIKPWNKADLIKKLVLLLRDKKLAKKLGKNGKETAEKYSYKILAKELIGVFESIRK